MKLFLVNGFLGSGKTTAIQQAASQLIQDGIKTGVIVNDQGVQLVDQAFLESFDIPTCEVTDGCFCCNYEQLDANILAMNEVDELDVIFAESVGSCTDLIATVVNPLLHFHTDLEILVSVFADVRILPVLLQDSSYFFEEEVHYIYKKQLEEADILVINKKDLVDQQTLKEARRLIEEHYPDKKILCQNALDQTDIADWLHILSGMAPTTARQTLDIDYDLYGAGEAKLGWLDAEFEIRSKGNNTIESAYKFVNGIFETIRDKKLPIGHLKFLLKAENYRQKISFNVKNQSKIKPEANEYKTDYISILVNARVQTKPENLKKIVHETVKNIENEIVGTVKKKTLSAFQPGFPKPTHRMMS